VTVHDLIHERHDGQWLQRVSSYSKLRLHPEWVTAKLAAQGLTTRVRPGPAGMVCVVAIKP